MYLQKTSQNTHTYIPTSKYIFKYVNSFILKYFFINLKYIQTCGEYIYTPRCPNYIPIAAGRVISESISMLRHS